MFRKDQLQTANNIMYVKALFLELSYDKQDHVLFTLKEDDHAGFLSFPKLYLSLTKDDPTEYTFAMTVFNSWDHWQKISSSPSIKPTLEKLRKQNAVRIKSDALKAIKAEMEDGSKNRLSAAKYLIDKNLASGENLKKRATKKEKEEELTAAMSLVDEDAKRLGLKVVK